MKKEKKARAVQIAQHHREDPAKTLKKLNLNTNPEWTIHFGPIMVFTDLKSKEDKEKK